MADNLIRLQNIVGKQLGIDPNKVKPEADAVVSAVLFVQQKQIAHQSSAHAINTPVLLNMSQMSSTTPTSTSAHRGGAGADGTKKVGTEFQLGTAYYPDYLSDSKNPVWDTTTHRNGGAGCGELTYKGWRIKLERDVERMVANGITLVRIGEFSWSHVEPHQGAMSMSKPHTERFDAFLDLAHASHIQVIMCTPTATPPKWLFDLHPDITAVTRDGYRMPFGTRRHYDPTSKTFREHSKRITRVYADAFGSHPAVIGWQTDNEFGHHGSARPFGDDAAEAFQKWLATNKNSVSHLNEDWFNCFWSQNYNQEDFSDVPLPRQTWTDSNPHMELDFRRFATHAFCQLQRDQMTILRERSPNRWITHNFVPLFDDLDYFKLSQDLDVVGYDHYQVDPRPNPLSTVAQFSLMAGLKPGKPFLILEQQPTQVNWQEVNGRIPMGWLFLWACQAKVYGAGGMCYFSWQKMYGGSEQYHDGVIPHDVRIPVSRQEKVLRAKIQFFQQWERVIPADATLKKDVLVLDSVESRWTHDIYPQTTRWSAQELVNRVAQLCTSAGLGLHTADTVLSRTRDELYEFRLVVLPGQAFALSDEEQSILQSFLDQGGKVLSLPRTGYKHTNGKMAPTPCTFLDATDFYLDTYGALLEDETDNFVPKACDDRTAEQGETDTDTDVANTSFTGEIWSESICITAPLRWQAIATFTKGPYTGQSAAIQHFTSGSRAHGAGTWVHLATVPKVDADFTKWLWKALDMECAFMGDNMLEEGLHAYPLVQQAQSQSHSTNKAWMVLANTDAVRPIARPRRLSGCSDENVKVVLNGHLLRRELTLHSWDASSDTNLHMPPLSIEVIEY
jgi:beta-galactosidase